MNILIRGIYIMVQLYVAGEKVGTVEDAGRIITEYLQQNVSIEFRNDSGDVVGRFLPTTTVEPSVPWDLAVTKEELESRRASEFVSFEELKTRLGWQ